MVAGKNKRKFSVGSEVEVRRDGGAWFRGKVVRLAPHNKKLRHYMVQFESLLNEETTKPLMEGTICQNIRPQGPSPDPNRAFEVSDVVDAYQNDGWQRGIIHKVSVKEENGQSSSSTNYTVFFESPEELANFSAKDLRPSYDWVDDACIRAPKMPNLSAEDELRLQVKGELLNNVGDGGYGHEANCSAMDVVELPMTVCLESIGEGENVVRASVCGQMTEEGEIYTGTVVASVAPADEQHNAGRESACVVDTDLPSKAVEPLMMASMEPMVEEHNTPGGNATEINFHELAELAPEVILSPAAQEQNTPGVKATGMDFHDRATTVAELTPVVRFPPAGTGDTDLLEEPEWHLVKSPHLSKLWNDVESLEAFQLIPQKPHFKPLVNSEEFRREGDAIAKMITFNHLVLRARALKVDDDRSSFEECLDAASEVAQFGFDVERVEVRVKEMLKAKDSREELQDKVKNAGAQIEKTKMELTAQKSKEEKGASLTRKLTSLWKKICEFTGKAREEDSNIAMKDCEITTLQAKVSSMETRILELEHEYERLVALPF
ncbi:hypothetical protein Tsubulata_036571 [Turnera subulata]|uniref:Agenet domain-containing protein n=1 Tax=Turnera subulata TaxID=218843 RepID=A0A9Q0F9U8_9ROSI|nr:hypothetical protein Tsubulata_036571 [Turnera subulata]